MSTILGWRNWQARSTVNREAEGSSPPPRVLFVTCNFVHFFVIHHVRAPRSHAPVNFCNAVTSPRVSFFFVANLAIFCLN